MVGEAASLNETSDCAIKAIAITTGTPYKEVHARAAALGRKNGEGTHWHIITRIIHDLGHELKTTKPADFINQYPGVHKNLKSVTTHHPARFNKVWRDGKMYIFNCRGGHHVAAVVNGELHDWTVGTASRCIGIYEVVKKGENNC